MTMEEFEAPGGDENLQGTEEDDGDDGASLGCPETFFCSPEDIVDYHSSMLTSFESYLES